MNDILNITFNDFFFQELLESNLSVETKSELTEFLWAQKILTGRQYKLCMVRIKHKEAGIAKARERLRN